MKNNISQRFISAFSAAVIAASQVTTASLQAADHETDETAASAGRAEDCIHSEYECGHEWDHECDHECEHDCGHELAATGKGVKIALLDAGVKKYDTYSQESFVDDDTIDSDHGDTMMSILVAEVPDAEIMDERVLGDDGRGTYEDVWNGIRRAVDNGADIIVASFEGQSNSAPMREAVHYAELNDVLIVSAAGNTYGEEIRFPAAFDTVLSVGAIDEEGNIREYSNYGCYVDTYAVSSLGTSGAAQKAAAEAAALLECDRSLSAAELRDMLRLNTKAPVPETEEANADAVVSASSLCKKHNFEDWRYTKKATCTTAGERKRTCKNYGCGYTESEILSPSGHYMEYVVTRQPTCTSSGLKVGKCKNCDYTSGSTTIPATGHDWDNWTVTKKPTCTSEGRETRACKRYGCSKTETITLDKKAHQYKWETTRQPTCTATGEEKFYCTECGYISTTRPVKAKGHDWDKWTVVKEATCKEEGRETRACKAYGCGKTESRAIPKSDEHQYTWQTTKEPTCTEKGSWKCICVHCGYVAKTEVLAATGHDFGDWSVTRKATCTETGVAKRTCKRAGCGKTESKVIPKSDEHQYTWQTTKEPTCTEKGSWKCICVNCGYVAKTEVLAATGHDFGDWSVTRKPTCTETGVTKRTCKRDGCGKTETRVLDKKAHQYTWKTTRQPTCTATGSEDFTCINCGYVAKTQEIAANGHDWDKWTVVKKATCKEEGRETRACKKYGCGKTESRSIPKTGNHKYTWEVTRQPTCTSGGTKASKCSVCGYILTTVDIPPTGHDWEDWRIIKPESCAKPGKKVRTCKRYGCHATEEIEITIPHTNTWITTLQPTCTTDGRQVQKCTVCGTVSDSRKIPAPGHDFDHWKIVKSPTCTEDGRSERVCRRYGCHFIESQTIPSEGHKYKYITVINPMSTLEGVEEEVCVKCGNKTGKTRTIDYVDFRPESTNFFPMKFNYNGEADDDMLIPTQNVVTYNGKKVLCLTFKSNYPWTISAPDYVNIHDGATNKAVKSGKAGEQKLYIWLDEYRHFENMEEIPTLTFNIKGEEYTYEIEQFMVTQKGVYDDDTEDVYLNEYVESVRKHMENMKLSNVPDLDNTSDYLFGNKTTNGKIKVFPYDNNKYIAISSKSIDGDLEINYILFNTVAVPTEGYSDQLDFVLYIEEGNGMKIVQDGDVPVLDAKCRIDSSNLRIEDPEFNQKAQMVDNVADVVTLLENFGISFVPVGNGLSNAGKVTIGFAAKTPVNKTIGKVNNMMADSVKEGIPYKGDDPVIVDNTVGFESGCEMVYGNDPFRATCYGADFFSDTQYHFNIVDSNGEVYTFECDPLEKVATININCDGYLTSEDVDTILEAMSTTTASETSVIATATTASDTAAAETEPAETKPASTEPAETKPASTEPAEIKPAGTEPAAALGDINGDGMIDSNDASAVLEDYARASTGGESALDKNAADINGDGIIDSNDASIMLAYYAAVSTGRDIKIGDFITE